MGWKSIVAVSATYSIALIAGGHGAAPMLLVVYFGLTAIVGGERVHPFFVVAAIVAVFSLALLALLPFFSRVPLRKKKVLWLTVLLGLYASWAIAAGGAAIGESRNILGNFLAQMFFSFPFQITMAIVLSRAWKKHRHAHAES